METDAAFSASAWGTTPAPLDFGHVKRKLVMLSAIFHGLLQQPLHVQVDNFRFVCVVPRFPYGHLVQRWAAPPCRIARLASRSVPGLANIARNRSKGSLTAVAITYSRSCTGHDRATCDKRHRLLRASEYSYRKLCLISMVSMTLKNSTGSFQNSI